MNDIQLGVAIAKRKLKGVTKDGIETEIAVLIGMPKQFSDSSDIYTPYQLSCGGTDRVWYAAGIDAVQAIQLCLRMIDAELKALSSRLDLTITWEGDRNGRLGFTD